jgi:hypothetical protein
MQQRILKVEAEVDKVAQNSQVTKGKVKLAEEKVNKYVWLGKKHGLNFEDPREAQIIID